MPDVTEYTDERVFMNTRIGITLVTSRGTVAARTAIQEAFSKFDQVVERFTRFSPHSELARLNKSQAKPFKVSDDLFALIEKMLQVARLSDGAFDPTIIDLLEMYGFSAEQDYERMEDPSFLKQIQNYVQERPAFADIALDQAEKTITLKKRQRLDLGSIGKGYAIDLAAGVLDQHEGFLINAGGDLRAGGQTVDADSWKLGIVKLSLPNKPVSDPELLGHIRTRSLALAGSGGWVRRVSFFHHLLNPKSGLPNNLSSQSYVTAPDATTADLWSTALFTTGSRGIELINNQKDVEGLLITANGAVLKSRGFILD